jgi:hypothetical protein
MITITRIDTPLTKMEGHEILVVKTETFRYSIWGESQEDIEQAAINDVKDGFYQGSSGANYYAVSLGPLPDDDPLPEDE